MTQTQCHVKYVSPYDLGNGFRGDAGVDLKFVEKKEELFGGKIVVFDTGVKIAPEPGYFTILVAKSSLGKTGWSLANSVGIIDNGYRNTICAVMRRDIDDAPELVLGKFYVQLVSLPLSPMNLSPAISLDETDRGELGFGEGTMKRLGSC